MNSLLAQMRDLSRAIPDWIAEVLEPRSVRDERQARAMFEAARMDADDLLPVARLESVIFKKSLSDATLSVIKRRIRGQLSPDAVPTEGENHV